MTKFHAEFTDLLTVGGVVSKLGVLGGVKISLALWAVLDPVPL